MRIWKPIAIGSLAVLGLSAFVLLCCGSGGKKSGNDGNPNNPNNGGNTEQLSRKFDGSRAFTYLTDQVNFGFRIPGTPEHKRCGDYIVNTLRGIGWEVEEQTFNATVRGQSLPMRNIVARLGWISGKKDNVIIAAHWDTRPWADQDTGANRSKPVPGANDGASGVAVLLELARVFAETKPLVGVELVFFDGEDYGPEISAMFIGSKYFADRLSVARIDGYRWGVLLDMIGDADLRIMPEHYSEAVAGDVYDKICTVAGLLGYSSYFQTTGSQQILDDHIALIDRGVKMYDIIDFNYPWWHTIEDTPDKCRAESLQIIGRVMENLVYMETLNMTGE
jgi:hypothetical protein